MKKPTPILMTLHEVARLTGVSLSTVRRAVDSGLLQVTRPGPRVVRITRQAIDHWLASTSTANTSNA